jgi:hypothetical protein
MSMPRKLARTQPRMYAGKRMLLSHWCECPSCAFPANVVQFKRILHVEGRCPMCGDQV